MLVGSMIREQHQASSGATDVRVPRWLISAGPLARQHNSTAVVQIGPNGVMSRSTKEPDDFLVITESSRRDISLSSKGCCLIRGRKLEGAGSVGIRVGAGLHANGINLKRGARGMGCGVDVDCRTQRLHLDFVLQSLLD